MFSHTYPRSTLEGVQNSVHSIPLLKWVFYHCSVHSFYPFSQHSIYTSSSYQDPVLKMRYCTHKPEKGVKEVLHSSTLLYLECKISANKWQTSGHFWSTWDNIGTICCLLINEQLNLSKRTSDGCVEMVIMSDHRSTDVT